MLFYQGLLQHRTARRRCQLLNLWHRRPGKPSRSRLFCLRKQSARQRVTSELAAEFPLKLCCLAAAGVVRLEEYRVFGELVPARSRFLVHVRLAQLGHRYLCRAERLP